MIQKPINIEIFLLKKFKVLITNKKLKLISSGNYYLIKQFKNLTL